MPLEESAADVSASRASVRLAESAISASLASVELITPTTQLVWEQVSGEVHFLNEFWGDKYYEFTTQFALRCDNRDASFEMKTFKHSELTYFIL